MRIMLNFSSFFGNLQFFNYQRIIIQIHESSAGGQRIIYMKESTDKYHGTLNKTTKTINQISYSKDWNFIMTGSTDKFIRIFSANNGKLVMSYQSSSSFRPVIFTANCNVLAVGDFRGVISLVAAHSGKIIRKLHGHANVVDSLAVFTSVPWSMTSLGLDNQLKVWDSCSAKQQLSIQLEEHDFPGCIACSSDNQKLATILRNGGLYVYDFPSRTSKVIQTGSKFLLNAVFEEKSQTIICIDSDAQLLLINSESGATLNKIKLQKQAKLARFFQPLDVVATGNESGALSIWSMKSGEKKMECRFDNQIVSAVEFSPDGSMISTATWGGRLYVRSIELQC